MFMADSDIIRGLDNLKDAVSGKTPGYDYKNPNTDMMKAISKCIDAADGTIGSTYTYDNPNTDVIQKMDELADAIATHSGGGSSILITKTVTENKTYKALDDSADGYSEVTVNVPSEQPTLITKNVTENGTYNASDDSADGYSSVTVNVPVPVIPTGNHHDMWNCYSATRYNAGNPSSDFCIDNGELKEEVSCYIYPSTGYEGFCFECSNEYTLVSGNQYTLSFDVVCGHGFTIKSNGQFGIKYTATQIAGGSSSAFNLTCDVNFQRTTDRQSVSLTFTADDTNFFAICAAAVETAGELRLVGLKITPVT